jgi:hypothetical protein
MNLSKAQEVQAVMNGISRCERFINSLRGRGYEDEFEIYYRECMTCELEPEALKILVKHYEDRKAEFESKLSSL